MMYADHFGLAAEAFSLSPDPGFFFSGPDHMEALAGVKLAIEGQRGLAVVVGEVGTGKTTLLYSLLAELGPAVRTAYVSNSRVSFTQMLRLALADFGVPSDARDKADLLQALNAFLQRCADEGAIAALVVDEAQNLELETFEDLRLLSNFESWHGKLLQIVLVGQPELEEKLAEPRLRQVADRIAVYCRIAPLGRDDAERYVAHRIACAGGTDALFERAAVRRVARASGGFPRRINMLCHDALLFAFARDARCVTAGDVRGAIAQRGRHGRALRGARARWLAPRPLAAAACAAALAGAAWLWPDPERAVAAVATGRASVERPAAADAAGPASTAAPRADRDPSRPDADARPARSSAPGTATADARAAEADAVEAPAAISAHAVRVLPGITLTALARRYYGNDRSTTVDGIRRANPALVNPNVLPVGSTLSLPPTAGDSARKEIADE